MNDKKVTENLLALLEEEGQDFGFEEVNTFKEAGVLTKNLGLVVTDRDGVQHHFALLGSWDRD